MKINRFFLLLAVLLEFSFTARADLAAIFTNTAPARPSAIPRRTSIVFIQCHGLAPGDLSCYGQTNFQTPNLDRLAAGGIRFTNYFGGSDSVTTTALLLNGKDSGLLPGEANLAQRLNQGGYRTGLIGEWTYDREPWRQGFEQFAGFFTDLEAQNYYSKNIWRYPHVLLNESNQIQDKVLEHEMLYGNNGGKNDQYLPDVLVNATLNFIRLCQPDKSNHYRPFFLLVNLPAPRTATTGADNFPVPSDAPFTSESWPQAAKNRAALITRLDSGIGRLFEQLDKLKMTNNVAIFFSSSSLPEKFADTNLNFLLPKESFLAATNPVPALLPMIAYWPGTIATGQVSKLQWTTADFAPTALQIAYMKPVTNFTGISILQLLHDKPGTKTPVLPASGGSREF